MTTVATGRVSYEKVEGAEDVFTPEFLEYVVAAYDRFNGRVQDVRAKRKALLDMALKEHRLPAFPPRSEANSGDWKVPPVPEDLKRPGIEISGPVSITNMAINAVNPGPEGERAEGYLDDDEDSGGHRLLDTVAAARNRKAIAEHTLSLHVPERDRTYTIQEGDLPFFMHRERSLHLDEPDFKVDGKPIPATILGLALTLFHVGRVQANRGQGVYFYLPKVEVVEEAHFYREFFDFSKERLGYPEDAVIRAIFLVESLPAVYIMEELLYALGPYAAGLNAARWDLKASILEYIMTDPSMVWPDRFGVDIKTTPFIANIFRRLVAVCLKRGAVPIGGMATALPSRDDEVNQAAAASIHGDKEWEARQGFLRGWVAHIFHMKTAADPFKELLSTGWKPDPEMTNPDNYPVKVEVPEGSITIEGTRRNARMLIEYVEGWLSGRGAKGIDSLEGKPGVHPALMEDLATGRISVAQMAQRIIHSARDSNTGQLHDFALAKKLLQEEVEDILKIRKAALPAEEYSETEERYRKAYKVALRWIKNYTELNFRSLGTYTHADFDRIASEPDAFLIG
jgi:malate synthase